MKRTHRGLVLIACLLMVLTAACGERQPNTLGSPAAEKSEGLAPPSAIEPPQPPKEEKPVDTGYLEELEVHCGQYEGLYHLWVETDKESMQALTVKQYKNYTFRTGAKGGETPMTDADGEKQTVYWTTFVFPDGTGLCWHGGNWQWGSYGTLDESLRVPEPIYHIGSEDDDSKEVSVTPWSTAENTENEAG